MVTTTSTSKLFTQLTLGGKPQPVPLQHRIVMAPLTRLRTGEEGIPTDLVREYYAQRTTQGGLLIAEATNISPTARGYFGGILPVSSSAASMENVWTDAVTREGRKDHHTPRALDIEEIPGIIEHYKRAAQNAIAADFDGVELHATNGYLVEQFLCDGVNKRTDDYGGSIENRAQFLFEALECILSVLDSSQVVICLSPFGIMFGCTDSDSINTYGYVVKKINKYDLAYLHAIETRGRHVINPLTPAEGVAGHFCSLYNGMLMTVSDFSAAEAKKFVDEGIAELIAFRRPFISNPDLVKRIELDAPWNKWDQKTWYFGIPESKAAGYTDYPFLEEAK